jgi:hypothetical protein
MVAVMKEPPGAGIRKVRSNGAGNSVAMQAPVSLAQEFDFAAPIKTAASI